MFGKLTEEGIRKDFEETLSIFLVALLVFALRKKAEDRGKGLIPGIVFYLYYPVHLAVIYLLNLW